MAYVTVKITGTKRDVEVAESAIRAAVHRSPDVRAALETKYERRRGGMQTVLLFEVHGAHRNGKQR